MQEQTGLEWEGFEEFCEQCTQITYQQNSEDTVSPDKAKKQKISLKDRLRNSPCKKNKIKIKTVDDSLKDLQIQVPGQSNPFPDFIITPQRQIQQQKSNKKENKLSRIPIIRKEDEYRFMGNLVYRGFVPRSSDTFFRTHKQVQYNGNQNKTSSLMEKQKVGTQDAFFKYLGFIIRVAQSQFDAYMRMDTNTNGHRQWFYFSVRNSEISTVKFNVYRFKKRYSLFQRGMKPLVLSVKDGKGWRPCEGKVLYRQQKIQFQSKSQNYKPSYILTFQHTFLHEDDEVYFAAGIPYPLSLLNKRLDQLKEILMQNIIFTVENESKTLCGLDLPEITISPIQTNKPFNFIIINARTHPGQTSSSWALDGLLQRILTSKEAQKWIRECNICFKILPMLNPDGVFIGNYRTGIIGEDFNRKFYSGKKEHFPEIECLKKIVAKCKKDGKILLLLDLHGHSILKNSFIYGPEQTSFHNHPLRNLPFSLWHNSIYFRFSSCKFKFEKQMRETSRVYFQIKQQILTFTCEISLGLYQNGTSTNQMLEDDYKKFGASIFQSISELLTISKIQTYFIQQLNRNLSKDCTKTLNSYQKSFSTRQSVLQKIKSAKKQTKPEKSAYESLDPKRSSLKIRKKSERLHGQVLNTPISLKQTWTNKQTKECKNDGNSLTLHLLEKQVGQNMESMKAERLRYKKSVIENKFKIRRKSDLFKIVPERSSTNAKQMRQTDSKFQANEEFCLQMNRSATCDEAYLAEQVKLAMEDKKNSEDPIKADPQQQIQVIGQNFSQHYESMNDSDGSSEDLCQKQKQYIIECMQNNRGIKSLNYSQLIHEQKYETDRNKTIIHVNKFKEIRFRSIDEIRRVSFPARITKKDPRQPYKFRNLTHKSLGKQENEQKGGDSIPQMVRILQLNQRQKDKKPVRDPYMLIQIRNKHT